MTTVPPPPPNEQEQLTVQSLENMKQSALGSARLPHENPFWVNKSFKDFMPMVQAQYKFYEDAFVNKVKDGLIVAWEHPLEACGVTGAAGLILMRGPRRFLLRNTLGRLESEEARFNKVESRLKDLGQSVELLKKENKNTLLRAKFGEEELERGQSKLGNAGHEIQRLVKSIYKNESNAADLVDVLRAIPGRNSLKLRAEVASMAADLKRQRSELDKKIDKISEYGIRM